MKFFQTGVHEIKKAIKEVFKIAKFFLKQEKQKISLILLTHKVIIFFLIVSTFLSDKVATKIKKLINHKKNEREEKKIMKTTNTIIKITLVSLMGMFLQTTCYAENTAEETEAEEECNIDNYNEHISYGGAYTGCKLRGADFSGKNFTAANFNGADLRQADLSETNLLGAILIDADLRQAKLEKANLEGSNLYGTNFTNANLDGADLTEAHVIETNFNGANLSNTIWKGVSISCSISCMMRKANMYRADLSGAKLEKADLTGARNLSTIICDEDTDFPGRDQDFKSEHDIVCINSNN